MNAPDATRQDRLGWLAFALYEAWEQGITVEEDTDTLADWLLPRFTTRLAEAERRGAEKAWDRGCTAGKSITMRRMSDEPKAPEPVNPYRERAGRGALDTGIEEWDDKADDPIPFTVIQ